MSYGSPGVVRRRSARPCRPGPRRRGGRPYGRCPGSCVRRGHRPRPAGHARHRARGPPGRPRRSRRTDRAPGPRPAARRATPRWRTCPRAHGRRWGGCRFPVVRPGGGRRPCRRSRGSWARPYVARGRCTEGEPGRLRTSTIFRQPTAGARPEPPGSTAGGDRSHPRRAAGPVRRVPPVATAVLIPCPDTAPVRRPAGRTGRSAAPDIRPARGRRRRVRWPRRGRPRSLPRRR